MTLADGARLEIRAVEPTDTRVFEELLARLSPESRYRRFPTHMERLSASLLRYLTALDHDRQEALVAMDAATGEPVAVARYAAIADHPRTAEIAVAVSDAWQRRGIGRMLLGRLVARAGDHGIRCFSGLMLSDNTTTMKLMASIGPLVSRTDHGDSIQAGRPRRPPDRRQLTGSPGRDGRRDPADLTTPAGDPDAHLAKRRETRLMAILGCLQNCRVRRGK